MFNNKSVYERKERMAWVLTRRILIFGFWGRRPFQI